MKKYTEYAERLRRFIYAKWDTVEEFAEEVNMAADSIRTAYLSGRSMPGGEALRRFIGAGLNVEWYLTGLGLPPKPSTKEVVEHVKQLESDLKHWNEYLEKIETMLKSLHSENLDYIASNVQKYRLASEPEQSYKPKDGGEE